MQPALPKASSPCALPYQVRADDLAAQANIGAALSGPDMVALWKSDVGQYNELKPKFNANIAWAGEHCVSKPADRAPEAKPSWLDNLNPF